MQNEQAIRDGVRDYYGRELRSSGDLKTGACCCAQGPDERYKKLLLKLHPEVLNKFYGCGSPLPPVLEGATVLDLGCGTGRDVYLASALVGEAGLVIGVDMTGEQLEVARRHRDFHARAFGLPRSNVVFHQGLIEDLAELGIADAAVDVVISNCVINLSPAKERVFREILRVLKPGGELFFADVFADRRIPADLAADPVLRGECLGGAMYVQDFRRLLLRLGVRDYRILTRTPVPVTDPAVAARVGHVRFTSLLVRAFKLECLEDRCEDYGQEATYLGTFADCPDAFTLDDHHRFATGETVPVCGNTAAMLQRTRYARGFRVTGGTTTHHGLFACGAETGGGGGDCCADAPDQDCCPMPENGFERRLLEATGELLYGAGLETMQVNLGRLCNLSCRHCHLECSPARVELMDEATMQAVLANARKTPYRVIDITGGAPELHPRFEYFLRELAGCGACILLRSNLLALLEPGREGLIDLLRELRVQVVASLPCYREENVDAQRGPGVFAASIRALRALNRVGYGREKDLRLDMVHNPGAAALPGDQRELESAYRRELEQRFGVHFSNLIAIANQPIGRFRRELERRGEIEAYEQTLIRAFNPATVEHLMCRRQVCVDYDGRLYDCDFNLALRLDIDHGVSSRLQAFDRERLVRRRIVTGEHCFACTAGNGSSCGGALA